MKFARRTGWLGEDEKFYSYDRAVKKNHDALIKLRELVLKEFDLDPSFNVQVYGEIFGGSYPHPDVERVNDVSKVQKEVFYCPDIEFYPFDVYVRGEGVNYPIDHDVFERLMEEAGFDIYAKAIFTGSFEECLDYPNDYMDPIHKHFNLPEIEGNICEGNVLKPVKACCEPSGSRVILKSKNEKFTERKRVRKERKPVVVSEEAQEVVNLADEYINENRLRNVLSHLGKIKQEEFGKLMGAFALDVRNDMEGDDPEVFSRIDKDEVKRVNKTINNACACFIRNHFVNIIDGVF